MTRNDWQVPDGWQVVRLGDVAEVNRHSWNPEDGTSPILYLDLTAVTAPGTMDPPRSIRASDAPSRARRRVRAGDTLVSTVRPYLRGFARVREAPENLIASTGFAVVSPRPIVDGSFVYQHVMTPWFSNHLENAMTGQAYPAVRPRDVAAYSLALPPLPEQRAIAAVLDSIDEAIERDRGGNRSHRTSARRTPPRNAYTRRPRLAHRMEGRARHRDHPGGLGGGEAGGGGGGYPWRQWRYTLRKALQFSIWT